MSLQRGAIPGLQARPALSTGKAGTTKIEPFFDMDARLAISYTMVIDITRYLTTHLISLVITVVVNDDQEPYQVLVNGRLTPHQGYRELAVLAGVNKTFRAACALAPVCLNIGYWERITDGMVGALATMFPSMVCFDARGLEAVRRMLTDGGLLSLARCRKLTQLYIGGCQQITDEGVGGLVRGGLPGLKLIDLVDCGAKVTGASIVALAEGVPGLEVLRIKRDPGYKNDMLATKKSFPKGRLRRLTELHIAGGHVYDGVVLQCLNFPELTFLKLEGCYNLTDVGVRALARRHPQLSVLKMRGSSRLTDESMEALAKYCKNLAELDITYCSSVSYQGLVALAEGCRNLARLKVSGIPIPYYRIECLEKQFTSLVITW